MAMSSPELNLEIAQLPEHYPQQRHSIRHE